MVNDNSAAEYRPEVIVDFSVEDGLLSVHLRNIGRRSAYRVVTKFDKAFSGLHGHKCISEMRLFRRLDFMAPEKQFSQFVDSLPSYAKRKEPLRLKATVSYRDREGNRFEDTMVHDLRIYLELGQAKLIRANKGDF
jgi:hypothetical protein